MSPKEEKDTTPLEEGERRFMKQPFERLTVDIRDKFIEYEEVTDEIEAMHRVKNIKALQIDLCRRRKFTIYK